MNRIKIAVVGALVSALALTGCGSSNNFRDVKGVKSQDPDKIEVFNNVDANPNIVLVCIHAVAFGTTTRDYNSTFRVPEWDHLCPGYVGK